MAIIVAGFLWMAKTFSAVRFAIWLFRLAQRTWMGLRETQFYAGRAEPSGRRHRSSQTSYKILAKTGKYLDARRLPHLLKPCLNLSNFFLGNIAADQPLYILL